MDLKHLGQAFSVQGKCVSQCSAPSTEDVSVWPFLLSLPLQLKQLILSTLDVSGSIPGVSSRKSTLRIWWFVPKEQLRMKVPAFLTPHELHATGISGTTLVSKECTFGIRNGRTDLYCKQFPHLKGTSG